MTFNASGSYHIWGKQKVFVLCANQFSFDTFKALGDLDKEAEYFFVDKSEDLDDDSEGSLMILNDFPLNSNIESILEVIGKRLSLSRNNNKKLKT